MGTRLVAYVKFFLLILFAMAGPPVARAWRRLRGGPGRRILLLAEGPARSGNSPAARFRAHQYAPPLRRAGLEIVASSLRPPKYYGNFAFMDRLRRRPGWFALAAGAIEAIQSAVRLRDALRAPGYAAVWMQRDLLAVQDAWLEWMLAQTAPPIVLDIDDSIFMLPPWAAQGAPDRTEVEERLANKIASVASLADRIVASNDYLAEKLRAWNPRVDVIPTPVDADAYQPGGAERAPGPIRIGWMGTRSNLVYLREIAPALAEVTRDGEARLVVVTNPVPPSELPDLPPGAIEVRTWRLDRELEDLRSFDIGIMPLRDDAWTRGKAGFKLLSYMAVGVPSIASAVGVNPDIVEHMENGLLAASLEDWTSGLWRLVADAALRAKLAAAGRRTVEDRYSVARWAPQLVEILGDAGRGAAAARGARRRGRTVCVLAADDGESRAEAFAGDLASRGIDVCLATCGHRRGEWFRERRYGYERFRIASIPAGHPGRMGALVPLIWFLRCRKGEIDVAHWHGVSPLAPVALAAARLAGIPAVQYVTGAADGAALAGMRGARTGAAGRLLLRALGRPAAYVAGDAPAAEALRAGGIHPSRVIRLDGAGGGDAAELPCYCDRSAVAYSPHPASGCTPAAAASGS